MKDSTLSESLCAYFVLFLGITTTAYWIIDLAGGRFAYFNISTHVASWAALLLTTWYAYRLTKSRDGYAPIMTMSRAEIAVTLFAAIMAASAVTLTSQWLFYAVLIGSVLLL